MVSTIRGVIRKRGDTNDTKYCANNSNGNTENENDNSNDNDKVLSGKKSNSCIICSRNIIIIRHSY